MTYALLKFAHILGTMLIGAGLIGVWVSDLRSRQLRDLREFSEAIRNIAVLRWCCCSWRAGFACLWHVDDRRVLRRLGFHQGAVVGRNGRSIRL